MSLIQNLSRMFMILKTKFRQIEKLFFNFELQWRALIMLSNFEWSIFIEAKHTNAHEFFFSTLRKAREPNKLSESCKSYSKLEKQRNFLIVSSLFSWSHFLQARSRRISSAKSIFSGFSVENQCLCNYAHFLGNFLVFHIKLKHN